jgi:hypothetical protein
MAKARVWLNWEFFEVALIGPLFPTSISLDSIRQIISSIPTPQSIFHSKISNLELPLSSN